MEAEQVQWGLAALRWVEVVTVREGSGGGDGEGGNRFGMVGMEEDGRRQDGGGGVKGEGGAGEIPSHREGTKGEPTRGTRSGVDTVGFHLKQ